MHDGPPETGADLIERLGFNPSGSEISPATYKEARETENELAEKRKTAELLGRCTSAIELLKTPGFGEMVKEELNKAPEGDKSLKTFDELLQEVATITLEEEEPFDVAKDGTVTRHVKSEAGEEWTLELLPTKNSSLFEQNFRLTNGRGEGLGCHITAHEGDNIHVDLQITEVKRKFMSRQDQPETKTVSFNVHAPEEPSEE